jgi:hypothetical protein
MKLNQNFSIVNMAQQDIPVVTEDTKTRYSWVPVGINGHDDFFQAITEGYNSSTTNAASIEGIADMIFGKGIFSKNHLRKKLKEFLLI